MCNYVDLRYKREEIQMIMQTQINRGQGDRSEFESDLENNTKA